MNEALERALSIVLRGGELKSAPHRIKLGTNYDNGVFSTLLALIDPDVIAAVDACPWLARDLDATAKALDGVDRWAETFREESDRFRKAGGSATTEDEWLLSWYKDLSVTRNAVRAERARLGRELTRILEMIERDGSSDLEPVARLIRLELNGIRTKEPEIERKSLLGYALTRLPIAEYRRLKKHPALVLRFVELGRISREIDTRLERLNVTLAFADGYEERGIALSQLTIPLANIVGSIREDRSALNELAGRLNDFEDDVRRSGFPGLVWIFEHFVAYVRSLIAAIEASAANFSGYLRDAEVAERIERGMGR